MLFYVPHLLITGNRPHSASLNSNRQVQTVDNYGRGYGRQGKNSQETIVQPWGRVLVPLQGTFITISLSCFMNIETHDRWEKVTVFCPQALRCQIGWNGWCWLPITSPPTNQENVHELIMPSLNHCYKTSRSTLQGKTHSIEGVSPPHPPLPGKASQLFLFLFLFFYFTQNSCLWDLIWCWGTEAGFGFKNRPELQGYMHWKSVSHLCFGNPVLLFYFQIDFLIIHTL